MKIEVYENQGRGFRRADFLDANGEACSIQESSVATEPMLWLGKNSGTHHSGGQCLARMHLTREQVEALLPLLQQFCWTGELSGETIHLEAAEAGTLGAQLAAVRARVGEVAAEMVVQSGVRRWWRPLLAVTLASFGGVLIGASVGQLGYFNPFALAGDALVIGSTVAARGIWR